MGRDDGRSLLEKLRQVSRGGPPSTSDVKDELLAYWEPDTVFTLPELRVLYDEGETLGGVGVPAQKAENYLTKYNKIIYRAPGKGPIVDPDEAKGFLKKKMPDIVAEITKRATP